MLADKNKKEHQWQLVWQDDFGQAGPDTSVWTRIPPNKADWGKHMTDQDICYDQKNSLLYLRGIVNPDTSIDKRPYLTGGIYTKGKLAFQYGKIEIRAKLECAQGAWPAMWMLAEQNKYGEYPRNGEIDIMEHLNYDSIIYQTTHSYYTLNLRKKDNPKHFGTSSFNRDDFNVFGLKWFPDKLVFTLNGRETFVYPRIVGADKSQWPYDQPFYLLIDQQLGGSWVGKVTAETLPVQLIIDWVKLYQ